MKKDLQDWFLSQRWLWRKFYNHYDNRWTYEHLIIRGCVIKCDNPDLIIEEIKEFMYIK
jgi:hypothetical protein